MDNYATSILYYIPLIYNNKKEENRDNSNVVNNNSSRSNNTNNDDGDGYPHVCFKWLFIVTILFFVLLIVVYRILRDEPDYTMLEFQVDSLEVTSMKVYNVSNYDYYSIVRDKKHITADLDFNLTLKNKVDGLKYFDPLQLSLLYHHDEFLSSTMLEPFLLLDQHHLQFEMRIKDDAHLQNETTADSISQDLWRQNVAQFALKAEGHYARWGFNTFRKCRINVICDDIKVRFLPANNMTTGSMIDSPLFCECKSDCNGV